MQSLSIFIVYLHLHSTEYCEMSELIRFNLKAIFSLTLSEIHLATYLRWVL